MSQAGLRTQVGQLARRSVLRTLRQPAQIVPALIFPLFLLAVLERFGSRVPASREAVAVRLDGGGEQIADVVRALDSEGLRIANIELHAPSLDDVFLEKTGRHLEGAGDEPGGEPGPEAVEAGV